jgi:D-glycero-alpha-D-manno-heptose-7-phosphate kinase
MKILSQAPCRVDLAGGTLDIWPLYLFHEGAVSVNFAVDRWTRAALQPRPGISGSSALIIAAVAAFNRWLACGYSIEKLREIAQNIEARIIRVPTGCQDYYPAMYGGVSAIELGCAGVAHHRIDVDIDEMDRRILVAYTGVPRNSGINNWEVTKGHIDGSRAVQRNFAMISSIAREMRQALERADWNETGRLLSVEWSHRRRNAPGISTPLIDRLVKSTRRAGALGAKVCGAGGGGCVLFFIEPDARERVTAAIAREGASVLPVRIARHGVQIRTVNQKAHTA